METEFTKLYFDIMTSIADAVGAILDIDEEDRTWVNPEE